MILLFIILNLKIFSLELDTILQKDKNIPGYNQVYDFRINKKNNDVIGIRQNRQLENSNNYEFFIYDTNKNYQKISTSEMNFPTTSDKLDPNSIFEIDSKSNIYFAIWESIYFYNNKEKIWYKLPDLNREISHTKYKIFFQKIFVDSNDNSFMVCSLDSVENHQGSTQIIKKVTYIYKLDDNKWVQSFRSNYEDEDYNKYFRDITDVVIHKNKYYIFTKAFPGHAGYINAKIFIFDENFNYIEQKIITDENNFIYQIYHVELVNNRFSIMSRNLILDQNQIFHFFPDENKFEKIQKFGDYEIKKVWNNDGYKHLIIGENIYLAQFGNVLYYHNGEFGYFDFGHSLPSIFNIDFDSDGYLYISGSMGLVRTKEQIGLTSGINNKIQFRFLDRIILEKNTIDLNKYIDIKQNTIQEIQIFDLKGNKTKMTNVYEPILDLTNFNGYGSIFIKTNQKAYILEFIKGN